MRTNSKTFSALNHSIRSVQSVQTEGIIGAVKRTAERVVNRVTGGRYETGAEAAARVDKARRDREKADADRKQSEYRKRLDATSERLAGERARRKRDEEEDARYRARKASREMEDRQDTRRVVQGYKKTL